jgi:hypothetical protein
MHHFDVLLDLVERFSNRDRPAVRGEFDHDSAQHKFDVPLERLDPNVSVILGDFVYDTRASLDYLITALVRSTGKEEHEASQFPIYTPGRIGWDRIDEWWDSSRKVDGNLKDTPPGTKAALKPLQPFYGVPVANWIGHPLAVLAALSNRDKHRRLNLLAHRAGFDFVYGSGKPVFQFGTPLYRLMPERKEGDTYTVTLGTSGQTPDMDVYLVTTYQVALDEPPDVFGEVVELLTGINQFIDTRVLPAIRSLL